MLIIRLVAPRAVEAAPSRYVALRVLLIVTYGTPRLPPSGSTAGCALVLPKPSRQAKADAVGGLAHVYPYPPTNATRTQVRTLPLRIRHPRPSFLDQSNK